MLDLLASLLTGQVGASLRRFARLAIYAGLAFAFGFISLSAAAVALFVALDDAVGPARAALIVAAGAAVVAAIASIPLWRKPKPPPPSTAATLVELAVAIGLGLLAGRKDKGGAA